LAAHPKRQRLFPGDLQGHAPSVPLADNPGQAARRWSIQWVWSPIRLSRTLPGRVRVAPFGGVAEWLGRGLQNLVQRFNSAPRLKGIPAVRPIDISAADGGRCAASTTRTRGGGLVHPATSARRPRVLLIEEDAQHRERLRSELQAEGIDVVGAAGDGRKGIWLAHAMLPEIVLISRWLPVLDGFEVTRRIKEV